MRRHCFVALAATGLLLAAAGGASETPSLILTGVVVATIRATDARYPLFERAFEKATARVERSMAEGVVVPLPKDPGGGYTHERHKENYKIIHDAGILFQLTGERRYVDHVVAMLSAYAEMYTELPNHPQEKNQAPGRLFWQSLNEAVWLVYSIQGYDAVREALTPQQRELFEARVFRPMADFLSVGSPQTFRKIHNHGTWAAAAVGMTGYAIGDQSFVDRSIDGLDGDRTTGYLAQLDQLFSPDGYYTEGPYYQRYALMPFVLFAQAIDTNEPERNIFAYRDGIIPKAIDATIQQSYNGLFFPINDAIREKGLDTIELVYGVSIAYGLTGDKGLLSIAGLQGETVLSGDGLAVAKAQAEGLAEDYRLNTTVLRDGPDGQAGGLGILRMGAGMLAQTVVAKHTGMGMGHGHFDKLALIVYDAGNEILSDYGAARFLNVPSKAGGRYLPENESWAKSSIAHNTAVVDQENHFGGDWQRGQAFAPEITVFDAGEDVNIIAGRIDTAYDDAVLSRTTAQVRVDAGSPPVIIDVMRVEADRPVRIDLPFYFNGQIVDSDMTFDRATTHMSALGDENGFQHLWVEGTTETLLPRQRLSWLTAGRFYTLHMLPPTDASATIVRLGAGDPSFNLRTQQGILQTVMDVPRAEFISVIEPHGLYDPAAEVTVGSASAIDTVTVETGRSGRLIVITMKTGDRVVLGLANDPASRRRISIRHDGDTYRWSGAYKLFRR